MPYKQQPLNKSFATQYLQYNIIVLNFKWISKQSNTPYCFDLHSLLAVLFIFMTLELSRIKFFTITANIHTSI